MRRKAELRGFNYESGIRRCGCAETVREVMVQTVDREQMDRIYRDYSGMVYRLALLRCGSRADAEDVFQEVFLRLVRRPPEFESEEHVKAWLIRVTINCSHKLTNSAWFRKTEPADELFGCAESGAEGSPELIEAVLALPEKYRTVVHLFYYEGYSGAEIARLLGISESAVRTRMQRAREKLRATLGDDPGGEF